MSEQQTPLQVSIDHDDTDFRPPLPPRPTGATGEAMLSPSLSVVSPHSREFSLRRKPVTPRRSSQLSLDNRSYDLVEMTEVDSEDGLKDSTDGPTIDFLQPKAFYKTHQFFRWNLGYWRMPARHFSIFAILFLATFLPFWYTQYGFSTIQNSSISPFEYDCNQSGGWSYVGISLQFGRFSFGQAKAIDLAWNWVVGRGLQGILTILAYRVFCDALLRATELTALPFDLYVTLALPSAKLELLWKLTPALFKYGRWRVKAIFVWMIISTVYLITVPGLMDAATAYESALTTEFGWPNGTAQDVLKLSTWKSTPDIVETTQICASYNINTTESARVKFYNLNYTAYEISRSNTEYSAWLQNCTVYGSDYRVGSPLAAQDLLTVYNWQDQKLNDSWWTHFRENPYEAIEISMWTVWGFYPTDRKYYKCVTELGIYQWGFSFEWLFTITLLNSIWLCGLWILWVDCDTNSEFCRKRRRLGTWRAIADVAEAMQEFLGPNTCAYSETELWEALKKQPPVKYYSTRPKDGDPGHIGLSARNSGRVNLLWNQEYGKKDR